MIKKTKNKENSQKRYFALYDPNAYVKSDPGYHRMKIFSGSEEQARAEAINFVQTEALYILPGKESVLLAKIPTGEAIDPSTNMLVATRHPPYDDDREFFYQVSRCPQNELEATLRKLASARPLAIYWGIEEDVDKLIQEQGRQLSDISNWGKDLKKIFD